MTFFCYTLNTDFNKTIIKSIVNLYLFSGLSGEDGNKIYDSLFDNHNFSSITVIGLNTSRFTPGGIISAFPESSKLVIFLDTEIAFVDNKDKIYEKFYKLSD